METLCKLYLELANVVPQDCVSAREKEKQKHIDTYGIALLMISQGCDDPRSVAEKALSKYQ